MTNHHRCAALALALFAASSGASAHAAIAFDSQTQANGSASAIGDVLTLTLAGEYEAGSAFLLSPIDTSRAFTTSFTLDLLQANAGSQGEGVAFVIQNNAAGLDALGAAGAGLGVAGVTNSVGLNFRSYIYNSVSFFTNGNVASDIPFALSGQDNLIEVDLTYAPGQFNFAANNISTGETIAGSFAFDLTALGPTAFVGFTGSTGGAVSIQQVREFEFTPGEIVGPGVPEPATWAMMIIGFGSAGMVLRRRRAACA